MTFLIIFGFVIIIFGLISYVINKSVEIDPKEPFLKGDYDERKDPTIKHLRVFCENCVFYKKGKCEKQNNTKINDEIINECKSSSLFVVK